MFNLSTRPTTVSDLRAIAQEMRIADQEECYASGVSPRNALYQAYSASDQSFTILSPDDKPIAVFGVGPSEPAFVGCVWMLGTDDIAKYKFSFLRQSREWFDRFHHKYPVLWNFVDSRNRTHIRWLKWLGCYFIGKKKFTDDGPDFYEFIHI